jgi:hypothetical protein
MRIEEYLLDRFKNDQKAAQVEGGLCWCATKQQQEVFAHAREECGGEIDNINFRWQYPDDAS